MFLRPPSSMASCDKDHAAIHLLKWLGCNTIIHFLFLCLAWVFAIPCESLWGLLIYIYLCCNLPDIFFHQPYCQCQMSVFFVCFTQLLARQWKKKCFSFQNVRARLTLLCHITVPSLSGDGRPSGDNKDTKVFAFLKMQVSLCMLCYFPCHCCLWNSYIFSAPRLQ